MNATTDLLRGELERLREDGQRERGQGEGEGLRRIHEAPPNACSTTWARRRSFSIRSPTSMLVNVGT